MVGEAGQTEALRAWVPRCGDAFARRVAAIARLLCREWALWLAVSLLVFLHFALVLRQFPLSVAMGSYPFSYGDLPLHFAPCYLGRTLLDGGGGIAGYAVDYMAGYPFGTWDSFTQRGYEYASLLLPGLSLVRVFNLYVILTAVLPPLVVALAAVVLGLGRRSVALCLSVAVVLYQLDDPLAFFWTYGNMGFPLVNAMGVLYLAVAWRALRCRSLPLALAGGVLLAAVGWLHQMAAVPVLAGSVFLAFSERRSVFTWRGGACAVIIPLVALLLLGPWLRALWAFAEYRIPRGTPALTSGWKHLVCDILSDRAYRHHMDRRALLHVEIVLLVLGVLRARRASVGGVTAFAGAAAVSFLASYAFSYSALLKETEPYRYLVSFAVFSTIPVTLGGLHLANMLKETNRAARLVAAALGLALAPSLTGYVFDTIGRWSNQAVSAEERTVLEWFRTRANREGRVLCRDERLGDLLPPFTGLPVLGGGMTQCSPLAHKESWLRGKRFFERPEVTSEELAEYLRTYNVAYVVMPSERFQDLLLKIKGCRVCFRPGRRVVYALDPAGLSYVMECNAASGVRVEARMNSLHVSSAPKGRFTLKYHYQKTLTAVSGVRLYPVSVPGDPVGFLGVDNTLGLSEICIRNGR